MPVTARCTDPESPLQPWPALRVHDKPWLQSCVDRCQALAGLPIEPQSPVPFDELRALIAGLPGGIGPLEQVLIRGLVGQIVGRVAVRRQIAQRPHVAAAFVDFMASHEARADWPGELLRLVDCCADALADLPHAAGRHAAAGYVRSVLTAIEIRYAEPDLTLANLAKQTKVSLGHLSRLLNQHTGRRFSDHLHDRRIRAAHELLTAADLSVKEVAAAVGYNSVTQLDRHYKRLFDATPVSARGAALSRRQRRASMLAIPPAHQQLYTVRKS